MSKITLTDLVNLQNETTAVNAINANNATLRATFEDTLSRNGSIPNQMEANLDMNSNRILNCVSPSSPSEPVTLAYLETISAGVVSGVSSVSTYSTRSLAVAAHVPATTVVVQTGGYASAGDGGGGLYTQTNDSAAIGVFQSADGQYWKPDFSRGINLRQLGAGQGNGAADVAAMTAAIAATDVTIISGQPVGYNILLTTGSPFDFSTGQFLITQNGTRILGDSMRSSGIIFNPASAATLFTFYRAGDLTGGIANCEVSNLLIYSTNSVQKTIINPKNSTNFLMDRINFQGITSGGNSIALLYQGRNLLVMKDCTVGADLPVYFYTNPEPDILTDGEDGDYMTFERNQLDCQDANAACYTVTENLSLTNWVDRDSDWALGRYGVLCVDTTATSTSYAWRFEGVRREQEQGVNPVMFQINRSAAILRNLQIINCAVGTGQLFNLTGIDRIDIENTTMFPNNVPLGTASSTATPLRWNNLFCQSGNTVSIGAGLNLIKGSEKIGGTNSAPIYKHALYSSASDAQIEWLGPPSANGRRTGIWRAVADVPVYTGANAYDLLPWSLYTIQYAEIRVSASGFSGIAEFLIGQVAPAGITKLVGQTNFDIDAGAGHLSVYHFSDSIVSIVNKLAGATAITVEVLFTI